MSVITFVTDLDESDVSLATKSAMMLQIIWLSLTTERSTEHHLEYHKNKLWTCLNDKFIHIYTKY